MSIISEESVLNALRHIIDPDLGRDIVSLGFVKNLAISGDAVSFTLELTTPACPVRESFRMQCIESVRAVPGVARVDIEMTAMAPKQRRHTGDEINTLSEVDVLVAVSACKGGVGKSTIAAQLARAMQREGKAVALLDADVYGPSVPTLFNIQRPEIFMKDNKIQPVVVDGLKVMSMGFLLGESPAVVRGPIVSNYVQQTLKQTDWGKLDYLIIDMPPGTGDVQLTLVQQAALDGAIIVTTPHALSLVDVARGILMFEKVNVPVLGVVENMSYYNCPKCEERHYPFGHGSRSLQDRFGLETLAELPIVPGISDVAGPLSDALRSVFDGLADHVHRAIGKSRIEGRAHPAIELLPDAVQIRWQDGFEASLPFFSLRCVCPCALCVEEMTGRRTLRPEDIDAHVRVESMQPLGNYAVSFAWSDGHTSGIYSWRFLREFAEREAGVSA